MATLGQILDNTTALSSMAISPYEVVYGQKPPLFIICKTRVTKVWAVDMELQRLLNYGTRIE